MANLGTLHCITNPHACVWPIDGSCKVLLYEHLSLEQNCARGLEGQEADFCMQMDLPVQQPMRAALNKMRELAAERFGWEEEHCALAATTGRWQRGLCVCVCVWQLTHSCAGSVLLSEPHNQRQIGCIAVGAA